MLSDYHKSLLATVINEVNSKEYGGTESWRARTTQALMTAIADPNNAEQVEYLRKAKEVYDVQGHLEIDDNAVVSQSNEGAYVQCWVWVPRR